VRRLSERLEALSPEKRAMLEEQLAPRRRTHTPKADLERISREGVLGLSFAQERMWFLDRLEPQSAAYNMPAAFHLRGRLSVSALRRSLEEIVRRHEVLRSSFDEAFGEPRVTIRDPHPIELPVTDLRVHTDREGLLRVAGQAECQRPFDLTVGPLFRAKLFQLDEEEHVVLLTMHHIVSDGWSIGVFGQELSTLYEAFAQNRPSPLGEQPIQYVDYAAWQRQWLAGEVLERQLRYWTTQLAGAPGAIELPTDRPRPAKQRFRGTVHQAELDPALTNDLRKLTHGEGATPFMSLLAVFGVLLSRYSGQKDLVIGTPIANRTRAETEGLIGLFVNSLALRIDLTGSPNFRELLARVKQTALDAYAHQDTPFERLVAELRPIRDVSRAPLFQVMMALQNVPTPPIKVGALDYGRYFIPYETAKFDLSFYLFETGPTLHGGVEYNTDLFDAATIGRMIAHWRRLLQSVVRSPDTCVFELPMFTDAELHQAVVAWNDTSSDYLVGNLVHELFEQQVARTPDAVAVQFGDQRHTYRQVNDRANALAKQLRARGVGPEVIVALCAERSSEMVVGLLAILKSGGAYLPLDAAFPEEHLRFMLSDAGVHVVATQAHLARLIAAPGLDIVLLDDASMGDRVDAVSLPRTACPMNVAYVAYTSRCTGVPIAVAVPHEAFVNLLRALRDKVELDKHDVLVAAATLSADIAGVELLLPLSVGAQVSVCGLEDAQGGARLMRYATVSRGTVLSATPAGWRAILSAGWQGNDAAKAICWGEVLRQPLADALRGRCSTVWNMYGLAEATGWSTAMQLGCNAEVSIGRPLSNVQVYVLDSRSQVAPNGVNGELMIGGDGVARGYLGHAARTAEMFVPNPFGGAGSRLCRTGDIARCSKDGALRIVGRADGWIEQRGARVRREDLEAMLAKHPMVKDAVVKTGATREGMRLFAYVVPKRNGLSESELREQFRQLLPDNMMPTSVIIIEDLPLTAYGRVDRMALPTANVLEEKNGYVAPRGSNEEAMTGIWAELLGVSRVGTRDNFFDLGGHSLLATQLVVQLWQRLRIEIPVRSIFEHPTIADLVRATGGDNTETGEL
jgi:amino acid adenylation domain-containing protein